MNRIKKMLIFSLTLLSLCTVTETGKRKGHRGKKRNRGQKGQRKRTPRANRKNLKLKKARNNQKRFFKSHKWYVAKNENNNLNENSHKKWWQ